MFAPDLRAQAEDILARARARGLRIATAESCTGGLIAACLTEIAGSSDVFERGFVTYADDAKVELLEVSTGLVAEHGAVSEAVARAMAEGAIYHSPADVAVSCTGIAGPGGGSPEKPVGLVHMACARRGDATIHERHLFGQIGRSAVRLAAVAAALRLIAARL